jgi:hypothetical protein
MYCPCPVLSDAGVLIVHLYCHLLPASHRYHTDPSGTYVKYRCMAIGSGSEGAQTALQEHYKDDITLAEAEVLALTTLKQVMEEKVRGGGGRKPGRQGGGETGKGEGGGEVSGRLGTSRPCVKLLPHGSKTHCIDVVSGLEL